MAFRNLALGLALGLAALAAGPGCSGGDTGDGVKAEDHQALTGMNAAAKRTDGDFDKLSATERQEALKMANGNEAAARNLLKMMAHPPNEANRGRAGGPPQ